MTWMDATLVVALIVFIGAGAKLGSVWTSSCVAAGFAGSFLADTYAPAVGSMIGGFWGSSVLAGLGLYVLSTAVLLAVGWILSKVVGGLFLGFVDGLFGVVTGLLAGFFAAAVVLLMVVPTFPKVERLPAWKHSWAVKPLQHSLEEWFNTARVPAARLVFPSPASIGKGLGSATDRVEDSLRVPAQRVVNNFKKE